MLQTLPSSPFDEALRTLQAGDVLEGRYRLEEPIGRGGMAQVWRATHVTIQRPVAVKFLEIRGEPHAVRARFLREAQAAAAVRHRYVVDVLDFGATDAGIPFMVMELLPGRTLADRLEDGEGISLRESVRLVARILAGLDAVHTAGIVHGDLKPENVALLTEDGQEDVPKLLDFGVSRITHRDDTRSIRSVVPTEERAIVGTPHYMSPEQASGERLDVRSDVFSVGVLLYLCWTGCLPFEGVDPVDTLRLVRDARPTEVGRLRPDLPPRLREVLAKAMARDRADRFPSASVMRRALLEAALAGVESSSAAELSGASVPPPADRQEILAELAEPVTSDTRLPEQRAAPRWWIAAAVALIGMLVLLLVVVAMRGRAPTEPVVTRLPMTATSAAPPTAVSDAPTEAASAAQPEGTERAEAPPAVPVVSSAPSAAEPAPAPFEPAARRGTPARVAPLREGRAPAGGAPRRAHSGLVRDPGF